MSHHLEDYARNVFTEQLHFDYLQNWTNNSTCCSWHWLADTSCRLYLKHMAELWSGSSIDIRLQSVWKHGKKQYLDEENSVKIQTESFWSQLNSVEGCVCGGGVVMPASELILACKHRPVSCIPQSSAGLCVINKLLPDFYFSSLLASDLGTKADWHVCFYRNSVISLQGL